MLTVGKTPILPTRISITVPRGAHPIGTCSAPVGGRLQLFKKAWRRICTDPWVLNVVTNGYDIEFTSPPPIQGGGRVTPIPEDPDKRAVLQEELALLIQKEAVVRATGEEGPLFLSSFFLAPKKPASWRPILNLRPLNTVYIRPRRFRMETLAVIIPSLQRGMWAASLDLQDAYLHVPVSFRSQRYLAFSYRQVQFKFRTLPFGLSTSPRVFTRVVGVVVAELRRRGILLFSYLDDWLILGAHRNQTSSAVSETISLLDSLGWLINNRKSHLTPALALHYLGARIDLAAGRIFPSVERIDSLRESILTLEENPVSPAVAWLRVLGLMASLVDVVPLCRLYMRPIQFHLLSHFRPASRDLQVPVPMVHSVRNHLQWWMMDSNIFPGVPFQEDRPQMTLTTDASLHGWGAFCGGETLSGVWTEEESRLHINILELEAVVRALRALSSLVQGRSLTVFTDNTSVVAYINRQGGTRSQDLCMRAWTLLQWCQRNNILLRASHIAGKENVLADALS